MVVLDISIKLISWRIVPSGILRLVALVRTDVSEELSASFIRVTRIGVLGTILAVTSNRRTLRRNTTLMTEALFSFEASIFTRVTLGNILEDAILFCFLFEEIRTMDKVQKLNSNECYTPSSEPLRKYLPFFLFTAVKTSNLTSWFLIRLNVLTGKWTRHIRNSRWLSTSHTVLCSVLQQQPPIL
jgi:hypothetical protein